MSGGIFEAQHTVSDSLTENQIERNVVVFLEFHLIGLQTRMRNFLE